MYIIKLFFSLFVLQKGTLKVRFLLKAMALRLHDGKRPCNVAGVVFDLTGLALRQRLAPLVEGGNIALFKSFLVASESYLGRPLWKTWQAYSDTGRIHVEKKQTSCRGSSFACLSCLN